MHIGIWIATSVTVGVFAALLGRCRVLQGRVRQWHEHWLNTSRQLALQDAATARLEHENGQLRDQVEAWQRQVSRLESQLAKRERRS